MTEGIQQDTIWAAEGNPYVIQSGVYIAPGITLTINPGVHIKIGPNGGFNIDGRIISGSTLGDSVVFTSLKDDSIDGDTNTDGDSTTPAPGDWTAPIMFQQGSTGSFINTIVKYGGFENCYSGCQEIPAIKNDGGDLSITDSSFSDCPFAPVLQTSGSVTISNTDFERDFYALRIDGGSGSINHSNLAVGIGIANNSSSQIDATDNWWGHSSGPQDGGANSELHAIGAWAIGDVSYAPWLTEKLSVGASTRLSHEGVSCEENCFSNVLFIPGLEASRLYENEDRLWEPTLTGNVAISKLFLNSSGESVDENIYTKDIIDEALVPIIGPNIYKSFIEDMDILKNDGIINDWEAIPYDWRLSPEDILAKGNKSSDFISYLQATSSPYLIQELERLAHDSKTHRVTVIAHSNGGLIAKALMKILEDKNKAALVDKVVFIAVPQAGTPQTVGSLLHGFREGISFLVRASYMRILGNNMPSAYNLLPSTLFSSLTLHPVISFDPTSTIPWIEAMRNKYGLNLGPANGLYDFLQGDNHTFSDYSDLLTPIGLNPLLLAQTSAFHGVIDAWIPPSGVDVFQIAGWGLDTVSGIRYYEGSRDKVPVLLYKPDLVSSGDGTVLMSSAWALPTSEHVKNYWINLKEAGKGFKRNRGHADILEVSDVRKLIKDIITVEPENISEPLPVQLDSGEKLRFFIHSASTSVDAYDDLGNHTGISTSTGSIETAIPDTDYRQFGEVTYISIPHRRVSQVSESKIKILIANITALPTSAVVDVEDVAGDTVSTSTTYSDVLIPTSAPIVIDISPTSTSTDALPILEISHTENQQNVLGVGEEIPVQIQKKVYRPQALARSPSPTRSSAISSIVIPTSTIAISDKKIAITHDSLKNSMPELNNVPTPRNSQALGQAAVYPAVTSSLSFITKLFRNVINTFYVIFWKMDNLIHPARRADIDPTSRSTEMLKVL